MENVCRLLIGSFLQAVAREVSSCVAVMLSSRYGHEDELHNRVNDINKKLLQLCVQHMSRFSEPLPPEVRLHLRRLFYDDDSCSEFFALHGAILPRDDLAPTCNGPVGRLPTSGASRHFVGILNHFYALGGYEIMLARLEYTAACA